MTGLDETTLQAWRATANMEGDKRVLALLDEVERLNAEIAKSVDLWERLQAGANNVCAHCREPVAPMDAHVRSCPQNPIVGALMHMIDAAFVQHPLPWRREEDWTQEVIAADGCVIARCLTIAEADLIIEIANDYDRRTREALEDAEGNP